MKKNYERLSFLFVTKLMIVCLKNSIGFEYEAQ